MNTDFHHIRAERTIAILQATAADTEGIMGIIAGCIRHMNAQGIDQWDAIYPDRKMIEKDIAEGALYKAMEEGACLGMVVLNEKQPKEYEPVAWRFTQGSVLAVHRLGVDPKV